KGPFGAQDRIVTGYDIQQDSDRIGYQQDNSYPQLSYPVFGAHRITKLPCYPILSYPILCLVHTG
ncbi:hypothetical protein L195_g063016, partial [Trifolium pratense]